MNATMTEVPPWPPWILPALATENYRPALLTPWTIELDGETWTVATDGTCAILALGDFGAKKPPDGNWSPDFAQAFKAPAAPEFHPFKLSDLKAFTGRDEVRADCDKCDGCGTQTCKACDGAGIVGCLCPECDNEHEHDCSRCDGAGRKPCPVLHSE